MPQQRSAVSLGTPAASRTLGDQLLFAMLLGRFFEKLVVCFLLGCSAEHLFIKGSDRLLQHR